MTALALIVSVLLGAFTLSILAVPSLPNPVAHPHHVFAVPVSEVHPGRSAESRSLHRLIQRTRAAAPGMSPAHGTVVAAFYAPWQDAGLASFQANAERMTHVIPVWLRLTASGTELDLRDFDFSTNPKNQSVVDTARQKGVAILPLVSNAVGDGFDADRVHALLQSESHRDTLVQTLLTFVTDQGFQGINVDFEGLDDADRANYLDFLTRLHTKFAAQRLAVTVDVQGSWTSDFVAQVANRVDWIVLMAYDEHSADSEAGPVAGLNWADALLDQTLRIVPENKVVLGLGNYAYDWVRGAHDATDLSYQEAIATATGYRDEDAPKDVIDLDPASLNSHFEYQDDQNRVHDVWMMDAISAYNQWQAARTRGLRGAGLWTLGMEDPSIWTFFAKDRLFRTADPHGLDTIHLPYAVTDVGRGEILSVAQRPQEGHRTLTVERSSGLIVDQTYDRYPSPYVMRHSGYSAKRLALTFDDGPDPTFTPKILDELKELHVPATFFVVGENVEANPDLTRRIFDEGHDVGSHTFTHPNMGAVDETRAELEINATQRALQSTLGRSTILFRPPFNADSEPGSMSEVRPIELADRLGYVTVGEKIDPQDWNLVLNGRDKTAEDIADDVEQEILDDAAHHRDGNVILLHDAGGDRRRTIEALPMIVNRLRERGFTFVRISDLLGRSRDEVMPTVPPAERLKVAVAEIVFGTTFTAERLLAYGFVAAIILGLLRMALMSPLAILHHRRRRQRTFSPDFRPSVSILIAAYNEHNVIAATIQSVLVSNYPVSEVIVVDDGSSDGTYDAVAAEFGEDARVRLIRRENGGKAAALNDAIARATGEIIVCVDADTQMEPAAVGALVRHFEDPAIGAVAGNVEVGNADNIITNWQRVEYTTSQNLDRRAYALLNAVSVVPGAIGAWRRQAVVDAGGLVPDTLAEDMDLTWRLRRKGFRIETEPDAIAYTEAPDTLSAFFRQRFRWTYGTLQCLWKHRRAVGHYGYFGWLTLPSLWIFQVVFQCLGPLVDLQILACLVGYGLAWNETRIHPDAEMSGLNSASTSLVQAAMLYALLFSAELIGGYVAYRLARRKPTALGWLFLQRFAYRQIMYAVVIKSLGRAIAGGRQGWGKLKRKGTVSLPNHG